MCNAPKGHLICLKPLVVEGFCYLYSVKVDGDDSNAIILPGRKKNKNKKKEQVCATNVCYFHIKCQRKLCLIVIM